MTITGLSNKIGAMCRITTSKFDDLFGQMETASHADGIWTPSGKIK